MFETIIWSIFFGFGFFLFWIAILGDNAPMGIVVGSGLILGIVIACISFIISTHYSEEKKLLRILSGKNITLKCNNYILRNFNINMENKLIIWKNKDMAFNFNECQVLLPKENE